MTLQLFVWRDIEGEGGKRLLALIWAANGLESSKQARNYFEKQSIEVVCGASHPVDTLDDGLDLLIYYLELAPQHQQRMIYGLAVLGLDGDPQACPPEKAESVRTGVQRALRQRLDYNKILRSLNQMLRESERISVT